jgi:hypothetical protein
MSPRHGMNRIQQMELHKTKTFGFKAQGNKKKLASVSIAWLRTRFPQYAHLSDIELRKIAEKEL